MNLKERVKDQEKMIERQNIEIVRLQDVIFQKNQTLKQIAANQYGLQGIQEDYEPDSFDYYKQVSEYYANLVYRLQKVAREGLKDE